MTTATRGRPQATVSWPTDEQLKQMGLVRCPEDGCTTWLDPANVRGPYCMAHRRRGRPRPTADVERSLAELRFAPLPERSEHRRHRHR